MARAVAAHYNAYEAFPLYAAAVLANLASEQISPHATGLAVSFIVLRIASIFFTYSIGQIAFTRLVFRLFVPHFDVSSTRHHAVTPAAVKDYISQATP